MIFKVDTSELQKSLGDLQKKINVMVKMKATEGAKIFQNYAKKHRPWTDRTGNARKALVGKVDSIDSFGDGITVKISIAHGVDYGIYLELCNERRYAILMQTVQNNSDDVLELFAGQLGTARFGGIGF